MRIYLLLGLLAWCCPPARCQEISLLRPLIVRLDSGTVVRRPLIGIDTATYQAVRLGQDSDQQLLLVRAGRIAGLTAGRRADSLAYVRQGRELRASRLDIANLNGELTKSEVRNQKLLAQPLAKPWLLDPHFYQGTVLGVVVVTLLRLVVLH
jgi:hypothetical protein